MFRNIKNYFNKRNLKDKKYLYLFDEPNNEEYVCFDCETTGLDPKKDDIISIGAVIIKNNTIVASKKFVKFIKPKTKLQVEAIKVHHIRECDLQDAEEKKALEAAAEQFKPIVDQLSDALKAKTKEVRVTTRLVDSPACLVTSEGELSPQLIRMLQQAGQEVPESKPILEINPEHPLVKKLEGSAQFDDLANVIFDQAVIAEGGLPADPAEYIKRINSLLLK